MCWSASAQLTALQQGLLPTLEGRWHSVTRSATDYKKSSFSLHFQVLLPFSSVFTFTKCHSGDPLPPPYPTPPPAPPPPPITNCKQTQWPCPPIFPAVSNPCFPAATSRRSITPRGLVLPSCQVARTNTPKEHQYFYWLVTPSAVRLQKSRPGTFMLKNSPLFPKLWAWIHTIIRISSQGHKELNSVPIKWLNDFQGGKSRVLGLSVVRLKYIKRVWQPRLHHWNTKAISGVWQFIVSTALNKTKEDAHNALQRRNYEHTDAAFFSHVFLCVSCYFLGSAENCTVF